MPPRIQRSRPSSQAISRYVGYLCHFCALAISISVLACVVFPGFFFPLIGDIWLPPRPDKQPKLPYGLSLVDTADTERPKTVDVIFVHGLGSFPDTTWRKQATAQPESADNKTNEVSWIRDLLPSDIPAARLLFYNYDSTYFNNAPQKNLQDMGGDLLYSFRDSQLRKTPREKKRPIIFLAHSYGGLVVKEALVQAESHPGPNKDILSNAHGIIFLGTPHKGIENSKYSHVAAQWLALLGSNPDILADLETDSESLRNMHQQFMRSFGGLDMVNFFETRKLETKFVSLSIFPIRLMIVKKDSATFQAPSTRNHLIDTDHSGLNKFGSRKEEGYRKVLQSLRALINSASQKRNNVNGRLTDLLEPRWYRKVLQILRALISSASQKRKDLNGRLTGLLEPRRAMTSTVPYQTVKTFTNRGTLFTQLIKCLKEQASDQSSTRSIALWGRGGAGKSQLALRYIETHRNDYNPVLWVDANSPNSARQSFAAAFEELHLEYPSELMDQFRKGADTSTRDTTLIGEDRFVKEVLDWLKSRGPQHPKWLVVINNADDLSWIRPLIPWGERGTVILTSRNKLVSTLVKDAIHVDRMTENEAVKLLVQSAGLAACPLGSTQYQKAVSVVNTLECFPLAIDLAGYYVSQAPMMQEDLSLFLNAFKRNPRGVLTTSRPDNLDSYQLTVANVWDMSYKAINETSPASANLLLLLSFLYPAIVEDNLFSEASAGAFRSSISPTAWEQLLLTILSAPRRYTQAYYKWFWWFLRSLLPELVLPQCWLPQCWLLPLCTWVAVPFTYYRLTDRDRAWSQPPNEQLFELFGCFVLVPYFYGVIQKWDQDQWDSIARTAQIQDDQHHSLFSHLAEGLLLIGTWASWIVVFQQSNAARRQHLIYTRNGMHQPPVRNMRDISPFVYMVLLIVVEVVLHLLRVRLSTLRSYTPDIAFFSAATVLEDLICNSDIEEDRKARLEAITRFLAEEAQCASSFFWLSFGRLIMVTIRILIGLSCGLGALLAITFGTYEVLRLGVPLNLPPGNVFFFNDRQPPPHQSPWDGAYASLRWTTGYAAISYFALRILWQTQDSEKLLFSRIPPESPGLLHALLPSSTNGTWDSEAYTQALAPLLNYGLIQRIPGRGYFIHALVQWWGRQQLDVGQRQMWAMEGIRLVQYSMQGEHGRSNPEFLRHVVNHLIEIAGVLTSRENYLYADMRELMVPFVSAVSSIERFSTFAGIGA